MRRRSVPPAPQETLRPAPARRSWTQDDTTVRRFIAVLLAAGVALGILGFLAPTAWADPHAVFYTDKGQEQVFYNVLAALNQADYVEPPTVPQPPAIPSNTLTEFDYTTQNEDELRFPRIRVRAVTPDDGDLYYRLRLAELKRAARVRAELSHLACNFNSYADPDKECL